jgi:serine protease Do
MPSLQSKARCVLRAGIVGVSVAFSPPAWAAAPQEPARAAETALDVPALAEAVTPIVVNITATQVMRAEDPEATDPFEFFFGRRGGPDRAPRARKRTALASGFLLDPAGYVVTNAHVVEGAADLRVRLADERELKARVVGRDSKLDVALLKLEGAQNLPAARLGSSARLRVGEPVVAVGNPFGLGHTFTHGIVSATARAIGAGPYDDFIQTDASINPGNSGGPLFNARGEVVGVNTAMRAGANGIGFAIPIDEVKAVLPQLRDKGHVDRGQLGVTLQPVTPDLAKALGLEASRGALVAQVEPGGAAARAGVEPRDVIVAVGGIPVRRAGELPWIVAKNRSGARVTVTVVRDGRTIDRVATLDPLGEEGATPEEASPARPHPVEPGEEPLGVRVTEVPEGGVRVEEVLDEERAGELLPGDVIVEMNGEPATSVAALRSAEAKARSRSIAVLKVIRDDRPRYVAVPMS